MADTHKQFYSMFIKELQDVFSAEEQILQAMPKVINAVTTNELKEVLNDHFKETKAQKDRLVKLFQELGETPAGGNTQCEAMKGLITEGEKIIKETSPGIVRDAILIGALQKIEHYEIASYGTLATFAKHLELDNVEDLLGEILDEEWAADKKLTTAAEGGWFTSGINAEATS